MTLGQLGKKPSITKTGTRSFEERVASSALSLQLLHNVAVALDVKPVYGFVPIRGSFEQLADDKAMD